MRNRVELKFSYACQQGCSQEFLGLAPIAPPLTTSLHVKKKCYNGHRLHTVSHVSVENLSIEPKV